MGKTLVGKTILGYTVDMEIGSGGFGTVYKVSKTNAGGHYVYALKHLTLPTETQYRDVLNSMGGDHTMARNYFESVLSDIVNEINILHSLSEKSNGRIVAYYDNDVDRSEDPLRFNIYIRMEYLTPLQEYLTQQSVRVRDIVTLGQDILGALEVCHTNGIIHRDIKDDNIFVNKDGHFKLGDFGVAKLLRDTSRASSMKGTPSFMAPEVYFGQEEYDHTVDVYSLGVVLYKLLNHARIPFLPEYPAPITMSDVDTAIQKRMRAEIPPPPAFAGQALGEVILRALAPRDTRYASAEEFATALTTACATISSEALDMVVNENLTSSAIDDQSRAESSHTMGQHEMTVGADFAADSDAPNDCGADRLRDKHQDLFMSVGVDIKVQDRGNSGSPGSPAPKPSLPERVKAWSPQKKWLTVIGGMAGLAVIIAYFLISQQLSPTNIAMNYFDALDAGNSTIVRQTLDPYQISGMADADLQQYMAQLKASYFSTGVNNRSASEDTTAVNNAMLCQVTIRYWKNANATQDELQITMGRSSRNRYLIFPEWQVRGINGLTVPMVLDSNSPDQKRKFGTLLSSIFQYSFEILSIRNNNLDAYKAMLAPDSPALKEVDEWKSKHDNLFAVKQNMLASRSYSGGKHTIDRIIWKSRNRVEIQGKVEYQCKYIQNNTVMNNSEPYIATMRIIDGQPKLERMARQ